MKPSILTTGFLLASTSSLWAAECKQDVVPDPACTPGVVATSDPTDITSVIDGLTYTKRHRSWTRQRETRAKYGIDPSDHRPYQDDDRVPVCLGGDNTDPRNHWMQPGFGTVWTYKVKDELDDEACRQVKHGQISPVEAQGWFLAPDWRVAYCQIIGGLICADLVVSPR